MSRHGKYFILAGKRRRVLQVPLEIAGPWIEKKGNRTVGDTQVGTARVSTVFLFIDHSFGIGPPVLFETMIFGGPHNEEQWRYETLKQAEAGHKRIVVCLQNGLDPSPTNESL